MLNAMLAQHADKPSCVLQNKQTLFLPQGGDLGFFKNIILQGIGGSHKATQAQQNYADAEDEINEWVRSLVANPEHNIARMLRLVEERLHFIFFVLADLDEVSKVFETINNRGKPLTQMDLVKNHLIYMKTIHGWDDDVNETWRSIQETMIKTRMRGGESVDTVLRAVVNAMFRPGKRKSGETDYKIVKAHIKNPEAFTRFLEFLKSAFTTFKRMREANTTDPRNPVETQLTYLNHHPNVAGVLPLIVARQWIRRDGDDEASVLEAIEKANFRLYGVPGAANRSDSYNVILNNLAHAYLSCNINVESPSKMTISTGGKAVQSTCIIEMLTGIVSAHQKDGLHQIVEGLTLDDKNEDYDFYHWDALRYFLARWEESLLDKQSFDFGRLMRPFRGSLPNDYLAREHIVPTHSPEFITSYNERQQLRRLWQLHAVATGSEFCRIQQKFGHKT